MTKKLGLKGLTITQDLFFRACVACRKTQPAGAFLAAPGFARGRMEECKSCYGARVARSVGKSSLSRAQLVAMVQTAKSLPCSDCGSEYPGPCMEFDHVPDRGEKMFSLSRLPPSVDEEAVRREVAKCDLLCANCHRLRTVERGGVKRSEIDKLRSVLRRDDVLHDLMAARRGRSRTK